MKRASGSILVLLILGALAYSYRIPLENRFGGLLATVQSIVAPCKKPISYSVGEFDSKFGLTKRAFLQAIGAAEAIWEKPIGADLFSYSAEGTLKINLVYDYRQEATDKLKGLGLAVDASRDTYDSLELKYAQVKSTLSRAQTEFEASVARYQDNLESFNKDVEYWNSRGGAPKKEFERLESMKASLTEEQIAVREQQEDVNAYVEEVNALVVVLNGIAASLNVDVGKYNTVGAARGEEFTEGDYQQTGNKREINIYEFSSQNKLVRVLAHELGHALGLDHVEGANSIMYKLNQSTNEKVSPQDLAALKTKCGIR